MINLLAQGGTALATFEDPAGSTVVPTVSLAAGSFQGLILDATDPAQVPWAMAVGVSGLIGSASQASASVTYYRVQMGLRPACSGPLSCSSPTRSRPPRPPACWPTTRRGPPSSWGPRIVYTMSGNHVPTSILQDPPKHLDWFYDPQQKHGSWLNVDRSTSLNLTVTDSQTSAYSTQGDTTTDWTIGSSVTANVTASDDAGIGDVLDAGAGLSASASVGGSYDKNHDWYTSSSSSYSLTTTDSTNDADLLAGTMRTWQVYRYPIINYALKDKNNQPILGPGGQPQYGFYEITLPGSTVSFGPTESTFYADWYQPLHQNGNALSYPPLDPATNTVKLDTSTFGPPVALVPSGGYPSGVPTPTPLAQPLLNTPYSIGVSSEAVQLSFGSSSGAGDTSKATGTLSESADVDGGAWGDFKTGIVNSSVCVDVDVKVDNSNSWGSLNTSSSSTTSTNTFTISQDSAAESNWAYGAATAYYIDTVGTYRAAHGVNVLASKVAEQNWTDYYGGKPDPALNLPNRMVLAHNPNDPKVNSIPNWSNADTRQLIRGAWALRPDAAHGGKTGSLSAGATAPSPVDGDTLQLQVRVHNYSLDTPANAVPVEFWKVPRERRRHGERGPAAEAGDRRPGHHPRPGLGAGELPVEHRRHGPPGGAALPHLRRRRPQRRHEPQRPLEQRDPRPERPLRRPGHHRRHEARLRDLQLRPPGRPLHRAVRDARSRAEQAGLLRGDHPAQAGHPPPPGRHGGRPHRPGGGAPVRQRRRPRHPAPRRARRRPGAAAASTAVTAGSVQEVRAHLAATALGDNSVCHNKKNSAALMVYEGTPGQGGRLVGMKRVNGLVGNGPAGRWVTLPWTPREPGRHQLVLQLHASSMDPHAVPVETTLDVDVAPPTQPPATLARLLEVLRVVWLPADLRAALVAQVQAANAAALAGDQAGARAALADLQAQTAAAQQGKTVSGHSASRVSDLVDALLAQSAIAADCVPAPAATLATAGTPVAAATPTRAPSRPAHPGPPPARGGYPDGGGDRHPAAGRGHRHAHSGRHAGPGDRHRHSARQFDAGNAGARESHARCGEPYPAAHRDAGGAAPVVPPPVVPPPLTPPPAETVAPAGQPRAADGQAPGAAGA